MFLVFGIILRFIWIVFKVFLGPHGGILRVLFGIYIIFGSSSFNWSRAKGRSNYRVESFSYNLVE